MQLEQHLFTSLANDFENYHSFCNNTLEVLALNSLQKH